MIRCHTCGETRDTPAQIAVSDGPSEAWGVRAITRSAIDICPVCRSADVEEYVACDVDGCIEEAAEGYDQCAEHALTVVQDPYFEDPRETLIDIARCVGGAS